MLTISSDGQHVTVPGAGHGSDCKVPTQSAQRNQLHRCPEHIAHVPKSTHGHAASTHHLTRSARRSWLHTVGNLCNGAIKGLALHVLPPTGTQDTDATGSIRPRKRCGGRGSTWTTSCSTLSQLPACPGSACRAYKKHAHTARVHTGAHRRAQTQHTHLDTHARLRIPLHSWMCGVFCRQ